MSTRQRTDRFPAIPRGKHWIPSSLEFPTANYNIERSRECAMLKRIIGNERLGAERNPHLRGIDATFGGNDHRRWKSACRHHGFIATDVRIDNCAAAVAHENSSSR